MLSEGSLNLLLKERLAAFAWYYMFWDRSVDPMIRGSLCTFSVSVLLVRCFDWDSMPVAGTLQKPPEWYCSRVCKQEGQTHTKIRYLFLGG